VNRIQNRVLAPALRARGPVFLPAAVRLTVRTPVLRELPLRWMAFGLWPVHVKPSLRRAVTAGVQ
jgi:hypothetical protein